MTDLDLAAKPVGSTFVFDCECYPNYFLASFLCLESGKRLELEAFGEDGINAGKLEWVLVRFRLVGFNSKNYDLPMLTAALAGYSCESLHFVSQKLVTGLSPWVFEREFELTVPTYLNHIDLFEVIPLGASLKMRGAQMHAPTIQDLPFDPMVPLEAAQLPEIRSYCGNDLLVTRDLFLELSDQIGLREKMSQSYGVDVRSKSDAQIAEAVLGQRFKELTGRYPRKPKSRNGETIQYSVPAFLKFQSAELNQTLHRIASEKFTIGARTKSAKTGAVDCPAWLKNHRVTIGKAQYRLGIGGLHSCEESRAYKATDTVSIIDRDVASYYPAIILTQRLFPKQLGEKFLDVFGGIVTERLEAKRAKNTSKANSLKIVVNGSFGKLGSKFSILYSPELFLQVTLSGQLCLLMLIEMLELGGIEVVSANTDGVVMLCPQHLEPVYENVVAYWEKVTGFETEETRYSAYYARDVNNYVAVKPDNKIKSKGSYSNPWGEKKSAMRFQKNPTAMVCVQALHAFLKDRTPLETTIRACEDPRQFAIARKVKGGAVDAGGRELGRVVRWYWATGQGTGLFYKSNGNKVSESAGGREIQRMPDALPADLNYAPYLQRANAMLDSVGFRFKKQLSFADLKPAG